MVFNTVLNARFDLDNSNLQVNEPSPKAGWWQDRSLQIKALIFSTNFCSGDRSSIFNLILILI
jgi:hypothetical protein